MSFVLIGYIFTNGTRLDPGTFEGNTRAHSCKEAHPETLGLAVSLGNSQSKARRTICEGLLLFVLAGYLFLIGKCPDPGTCDWTTWAHSYKEAHLETLG